MESTLPNVAVDAKVHGKKRTAAQRAADLIFIEGHVLRGRAQAEVAELLAEVRPYRISRAQVAYDVDDLKKRWLAGAVETFGLAQARALRKLDEVEREAWAQFDLSKQGGEVGNAAHLKQVLEVHDRRVRLLGLDAPARSEVSGHGGGPIAVDSSDMQARLTPEMKNELFLRHMQRLAETNEKAAVTDPTDED